MKSIPVLLGLVLSISPVLAQESQKATGILGNDASAIMDYCVFQSQIYSVGITFCVMPGFLVKCHKPTPNQPAAWVQEASKACAKFN